MNSQLLEALEELNKIEYMSVLKMIVHKLNLELSIYSIKI